MAVAARGKIFEFNVDRPVFGLKRVDTRLVCDFQIAIRDDKTPDDEGWKRFRLVGRGRRCIGKKIRKVKLAIRVTNNVAGRMRQFDFAERPSPAK